MKSGDHNCIDSIKFPMLLFSKPIVGYSLRSEMNSLIKYEYKYSQLTFNLQGFTVFYGLNKIFDVEF